MMQIINYTLDLCPTRLCNSVPVASVLRYKLLSVQAANKNTESAETSIMETAACKEIVFSKVNVSNDHRQTVLSWLPETRTSPADVTLTEVTGPR